MLQFRFVVPTKCGDAGSTKPPPTVPHASALMTDHYQPEIAAGEISFILPQHPRITTQCRISQRAREGEIRHPITGASAHDCGMVCQCQRD